MIWFHVLMAIAGAPFPDTPSPRPSQSSSSTRVTPGAYVDAAFDVFVQTNITGWVRYAHLHVGNLEDAELIAFETVLRLHESWEHVLGHQRNVSMHALALLRGEIERWRQDHGIADQLVENAAFLRAMHAAHHGFALLAESIGVFSAIARLPERQFQVILLRFVLGYSARETAARMGVSPSTVGSLTHYAKRTLARELGIQDDEDPGGQRKPARTTEHTESTRPESVEEEPGDPEDFEDPGAAEGGCSP
jgi:RNA polymerase sigma factor (sigma-70 family)